MEKHEVPFGGVYRLSVGGQLVGEFVPGPLWTEIYQATDAAHDDVSYSWIPFAEDESEDEVQRLREAVEVAREGLVTAEDHIPQGVGTFGKGWILCSCGDDVRSFYWTRHSQGADGSALAPRTHELLPLRETV